MSKNYFLKRYLLSLQLHVRCNRTKITISDAPSICKSVGACNDPGLIHVAIVIHFTCDRHTSCLHTLGKLYNFVYVSNINAHDSMIQSCITYNAGPYVMVK